MKFQDINSQTTENLLNRFLTYVKIHTTSDSAQADQGIIPSTKRQQVLAETLVQELKNFGITDISITENSYVCARIPATKGMEKVPAVGFLAHMDTTEEVSGKDVKPNVIRNYDGNIIQLNHGIVLNPAEDFALTTAKGETIITTDGSTLLGADDKAGIAIIMTAIELLTQKDSEGNPIHPHGTIEILFSPDEETGHGMDKVPLEWFTAKQCYTVDGGAAPEIETECFNAWKSEIHFTGKSLHTGAARPNMVNAITLASEFVAFLPRQESPETTDGYQGFFAPMEIQGHIETADVTLFLRDFETEGMERRKKLVEDLANIVCKKNPGSSVTVKHTQQYLNMKEKISKNPLVIANLEKAVRQTGLEPKFIPIRGGTDGSRLTELGIPCPNIFTGGHNFHSRYEWVSLTQMVFGVATLLNLIALQTDN